MEYRVLVILETAPIKPYISCAKMCKQTYLVLAHQLGQMNKNQNWAQYSRIFQYVVATKAMARFGHVVKLQ